MKRLALPAAALLLVAGAARAEGPVSPPGGTDPMEAVREAAIRISKALKENEEALSKLARGEKAEPKAVDVALPPKENPKSPDPPPQAGGSKSESESESLRRTAEQGKAVVEGINTILETAARMGSQKQSSGEGGGGSGEGGKDPKESQRNSKKEQEAKKDPLKDNKPEDSRKPESPDRPKNSNDVKGATPPDPPKKSPPPADTRGIFYAKLPDKVREAIENGDFDQIPEKYRDLIREWTKSLSEQDRKDQERKDAGSDGR